MNERKTSSMLQRVPVILAVTAASYGLQLPPHMGRTGHGQVTASSTRTPGGEPVRAQLPRGTAARADHTA